MRKFILSAVAAFAAIGLGAQNVSDLIISEALAQPDSTGILDEYGRRTGWVELYNTSTGTVNYGGCFLTDDRGNLKKSIIPKADNRTKLGPRQVALFHCSGVGTDGTFYAGITLEPGKTVYLVSNDGRTIIDSLSIPSSLPIGKSVKKLPADIRQKVWVAQEEPSSPSPRILNGNPNAATNAEKMAERDPYGWILSLTSVCVVFSALAILWFLFWLLFDRPAKKKAEGDTRSKPGMTKARHSRPDRESEVAAAIALALDMEDTGDVYAAIATAVHLYLNDSIHDIEPGIITIVRKDSGWNNKALNFRKLPR